MQMQRTANQSMFRRIVLEWGVTAAVANQVLASDIGAQCEQCARIQRCIKMNVSYNVQYENDDTDTTFVCGRTTDEQPSTQPLATTKKKSALTVTCDAAGWTAITGETKTKQATRATTKAHETSPVPQSAVN
jgi:hypothetical protein